MDSHSGQASGKSTTSEFPRFKPALPRQINLKVKLPLECPLHPFRDVFAPRQDAKQRDRPTQWTCRKCGKSFYQEKHLDLHFDTRHKSIINEVKNYLERGLVLVY